MKTLSLGKVRRTHLICSKEAFLTHRTSAFKLQGQPCTSLPPSHGPSHGPYSESFSASAVSSFPASVPASAVPWVPDYVYYPATVS